MSEQPLSLADLQRMANAEAQQRAQRCLEKVQAALAENNCRIETLVQSHPTADGTAVMVRGAAWVVMANS